MSRPRHWKIYILKKIRICLSPPHSILFCVSLFIVSGAQNSRFNSNINHHQQQQYNSNQWRPWNPNTNANHNNNNSPENRKSENLHHHHHHNNNNNHPHNVNVGSRNPDDPKNFEILPSLDLSESFLKLAHNHVRSISGLREYPGYRENKGQSQQQQQHTDQSRAHSHNINQNQEQQHHHPPPPSINVPLSSVSIVHQSHPQIRQPPVQRQWTQSSDERSRKQQPQHDRREHKITSSSLPQQPVRNNQKEPIWTSSQNSVPQPTRNSLDRHSLERIVRDFNSMCSACFSTLNLDQVCAERGKHNL